MQREPKLFQTLRPVPICIPGPNHNLLLLSTCMVRVSAACSMDLNRGEPIPTRSSDCGDRGASPDSPALSHRSKTQTGSDPKGRKPASNAFAYRKLDTGFLPEGELPLPRFSTV